MPTHRDQLREDVSEIRKSLTPAPGKTFFQEFQESIVERAKELPLTALIGIPALFSTLLPILFKASAESGYFDASLIFRAFVFAYVAFPIGFLVCRAIRIANPWRVMLGLCVVVIAARWSFTISIFSGLGGAVLQHILTQTRTRQLHDSDPAPRVSHLNSLSEPLEVFPPQVARRRVPHAVLALLRFRLLAWVPLPFVLLAGLLVICAFLLDRNAPAGRYEGLFATSKVLSALDAALAQANYSNPPPMPSALFATEYDRARTDSVRRDQRLAISCVQRTYERGAALLQEVSTHKPLQRVSQIDLDSTNLHLCPRFSYLTDLRTKIGDDTATFGDFSAKPNPSQAIARGADSITRDSALAILGKRVNNAAVTLDYLLDTGLTAPDSISRWVVMKGLAAESSVLTAMGHRVVDISQDSSFRTYRNAETLRTTMLALRAAERDRAAQPAESLRRRLVEFRAMRYQSAQRELAVAFNSIRDVDAFTLLIALILVLTGLWRPKTSKGAARKLRRSPPAVEAVLANASPVRDNNNVNPRSEPSNSSSETPPDPTPAIEVERERQLKVIEGTYALGVAIFLLLLVPLLPTLKAEDLNPADPFGAFVQSSWYLPGFLVQHAQPAGDLRDGPTGNDPPVHIPVGTAGADTAGIRVQLDSLARLRDLLAAQIDSIPNHLRLELLDSLRIKLAAKIDSLPDSVRVRLDDATLKTVRDSIITAISRDSTHLQMARKVAAVQEGVGRLETSVTALYTTTQDVKKNVNTLNLRLQTRTTPPKQ